MSQKLSALLRQRVLFQPVAPYYADAYNTITSIVQGLALGVFGYEVAKLFFEEPSPLLPGTLPALAAVCKLFVAFLCICVLWHRYITHNQFYAWRLGIADTVIPIGFGLLEILLILSTVKSFIYFSAHFAGLATWGIVAYMNTIRRHNYPRQDPYVKSLYREHFCSLGQGFADNFFYALARFERRARLQLIITAVVMWALIMLMFAKPQLDAFTQPLFVVLAVAVLVYMLIFDLWWYLERDTALAALVPRQGLGLAAPVPAPIGTPRPKRRKSRK